jgi:hypothetical protein
MPSRNIRPPTGHDLSPDELRVLLADLYVIKGIQLGAPRPRWWHYRDVAYEDLKAAIEDRLGKSEKDDVHISRKLLRNDRKKDSMISHMNRMLELSPRAPSRLVEVRGNEQKVTHYRIRKLESSGVEELARNDAWSKIYGQITDKVSELYGNSRAADELLSNAVDGIDQAATALMPSTNRIP